MLQWLCRDYRPALVDWILYPRKMLLGCYWDDIIGFATSESDELSCFRSRSLEATYSIGLEVGLDYSNRGVGMSIELLVSIFVREIYLL